MLKISKTKTDASPPLSLRNDADAMLAIREVGILSRRIARADAELNDAIAVLHRQHADRTAPHKAQIAQLVNELQEFCEANRARLTDDGKTKTVKFITGTASWRARPPKVTLRKVEAVIENIKKLGFRKFLRWSVEVNKEAMLDDPERAKKVPGVTIGSAGEDFIVEPFEAATEGTPS